MLFIKLIEYFDQQKNLINTLDLLNNKKVAFKSITEPTFDFTTPHGRFFLIVIGAMAEFKRELIIECTKEGLKNARQRKILIGRPKGIQQTTMKKFERAKLLFNSGLSINEACRAVNIGKITYDRIIKTNNI